MLRKFFALLFTIICFSRLVLAGTPVVHTTAKPIWLSTYQPYTKDIPAREVENGYFTQLSEEQINIDKQADYTHIIRQIVSEAGIQNGSAISVNFDPSYQQLDFHEIIVWRDGKPQSRLSAGLFKIIADEQELDKFIYQGTYSAYCTLPDIRKGDRIEFSYTITGANPIFNNKFSRDINLQGSHQIAHIYYAFICQPQRKLNFKAFNTKSQFAENLKNGLKYYTLEDFQVKAAHDYDNEPAWYTNYAHIQVSEFNNWAEVVNWALSVNPIPTTVSGKVAAEVAVLKAEAKGDKIKYFRAAVKFVQDEVRYMGIEMGQYSHRANLPENVLNHRYGDCKDKSLLLATILNANDIPANLVLISTNLREKTAEYIASPTVFNHAVITATVNGTQVWVDATISYQRGSNLDLYFPAYRQGLVLKAGNNGITNIPLSPAGKITYLENYVIKSKSDTVDLRVETKYTRDDADDIREQLATSGLGETEKSYLEYYQKSYPKVEILDSLTINDDADKNEITTIEHYKLPDYFKKDTVNGKNQGELFAQYISSRLSNAGTQTKYPLALNYPTNINYVAKIVLPGGWIIKDERANVDRDAYKFEFSQKVNEDTLVMNYSLENLQSYIPLSEVDQYRDDVKKIKADYLSFNFTYSPDAEAGDKYVTNFALLGSILILILSLAVLAFKIYTKPTPILILRPGDGIRSFGGWVVFFGFILVIYTLAELKNLIDGHYFNLVSWRAHNGSVLEHSFKNMFLFEAIGTTFLACLSTFNVILYFKKRDIFPRYAGYLLISVLLFYVIDYFGSKALFANLEFEKTLEALIRAGISAAIWITYLRRSFRVKETFLVPYPHSNFVLEHELNTSTTQGDNTTITNDTERIETQSENQTSQGNSSNDD